jgi:putative copper resistance protein D
LYLDLAAAFGVAMFRLYALGNDERSSTISRRYRVLIGASAAIGIALSMWGDGHGQGHVRRPKLRGAVNARLRHAHYGHAHGHRLVHSHRAVGVCARRNVEIERYRFAVMALSTGGAGDPCVGGHGAMGDSVRGYIHLASDITHLWAAGLGGRIGGVLDAGIPQAGCRARPGSGPQSDVEWLSLA